MSISSNGLFCHSLGLYNYGSEFQFEKSFLDINVLLTFQLMIICLQWKILALSHMMKFSRKKLKIFTDILNASFEKKILIFINSCVVLFSLPTGESQILFCMAKISHHYRRSFQNIRLSPFTYQLFFQFKFELCCCSMIKIKQRF